MQLALNNVSVRFSTTTLLEKVQLQVQPGEFLVLIGPSGQGKTMTLKLFAGLLAPTSGQVLFEGQDIHAMPEKEREQVLLQMGMLFQRNALFDSLTAGENIAFPLREKTQMSDAQINEKVEFFLEQVGLAAARDLYPAELSGGMQKRLGIARALALSPKILLYDDPTAGLDPITSRRIIELIVRLGREQNSTLIAVTNDMARAYQLADRIAMVVDRQILVTGNKAETLAHPDPRVRQFIHGQLHGPLTEETL
jgi:phospholipid/cholesterol/gamma-HCH transport system ATP-binding protein